jgi:hypothetical protein
MILRTDGSEAHVAERAGSHEDAVALGASAGEELRAKAGDGFFAD